LMTNSAIVSLSPVVCHRPGGRGVSAVRTIAIRVAEATAIPPALPVAVQVVEHVASAARAAAEAQRWTGTRPWVMRVGVGPTRVIFPALNGHHRHSLQNRGTAWLAGAALQ
jgi:hypothetical protein